MSDLTLVPVTAYYLSAANVPTPLLAQNALMASDLAPYWENFREACIAAGFEPYISGPTDSSDPRGAQGYTKGFFRTPDDQALILLEGTDGAAAVDESPHQAGRAFDLDLAAIAAAFASYDYDQLSALANAYGFSSRVSGEPWHFDDDPASNPAFGSVEAAVEAVGNTADQEAADLAAGQPTAQQAAVEGSAVKTALLSVAALAALYFLYNAANRPVKKPEHSNTNGPEYVFQG